MTTCSIIIPVYGLSQVTRRCLETLLAAPPSSCRAEIIVVDDASPDDTAAVLRGLGDAIRVVSHEVNRGFARSCNDGAAAATGEYLAFLNNDTLPHARWLDALVTHALANPAAGVVGSKLLYPDGTIQHAGMVFDADLKPQHLYLGFPADHPAVSRPRRFATVTGASLLIGRATFEGLGGFDEGYVNGYEDVDLCLRVRELGFEVHYCPGSVAVHLESVSEGRTAKDRANRERFEARWSHKLTPDDVLHYLEDGLIRFEYRGSNPMRLWVAPELAAIDVEGRPPGADRLLFDRSRQVFELLKENIGLRVKLCQASLTA